MVEEHKASLNDNYIGWNIIIGMANLGLREPESSVVRVVEPLHVSDSIRPSGTTKITSNLRGEISFIIYIK